LDIEWKAGTTNADKPQTADTLEEKRLNPVMTDSSMIIGAKEIEEVGSK